MSTTTLPTRIDDLVNASILAVSEDQVQGFVEEPFGEIARLSGLGEEVVVERIRAMLQAGVIRRVRQTLLATNLAAGALVAWQFADHAAADRGFDWMFANDPFTGHVVIRTTDAATPGSSYRLWTTLKVPQGYELREHCELLQRLTGAVKFHVMPAKKIFALGVGHVRRKALEVGSKAEVVAEAMDVQQVELSELDWRVLEALKREFTVEEIGPHPWRARAAEAGVAYETFLEVARLLNQRKVIGRFSTFLEHVKPLADGSRVTRFNALYHFAVPAGREIEAGQQVGRFHILTHCYWREAGPEFRNVNIMAVAHGSDKAMVLAHKQAIDEHLAALGMGVTYSNVFWGGRSEIKPSEISPLAYAKWIAEQR